MKIKSGSRGSLRRPTSRCRSSRSGSVEKGKRQDSSTQSLASSLRRQCGRSPLTTGRVFRRFTRARRRKQRSLTGCSWERSSATDRVPQQPGTGFYFRHFSGQGLPRSPGKSEWNHFAKSTRNRPPARPLWLIVLTLPVLPGRSRGWASRASPGTGDQHLPPEKPVLL